MLYKLARFFFGLIFATFYRWRVRGRENVPAAGGVVIVANHRNFFDPMILGPAVHSRVIHYMAKAEVFGWPVAGALARAWHAFPVRRDGFDRQAIRTARELVKQGEVLGLFPEGTRFRDGRLHEIKSGAAMVHLATGAPIVPVGIDGSESLKFLRFPKIMVKIGPPLQVPTLKGVPEREAIAAVNAAIASGLESCLEEANSWRKRRVTAPQVS